MFHSLFANLGMFESRFIFRIRELIPGIAQEPYKCHKKENVEELVSLNLLKLVVRSIQSQMYSFMDARRLI